MTKRVSSFSEAEDDIILANPGLSAPALLELLPGHEKPAVQKRRRFLMNRDKWSTENDGRAWSDEERGLLKALFDLETSHMNMAIRLKRSEDAVVSQCRRDRLIRGHVYSDTEPKQIRAWPELSPNAFEDYRVGRDSRFVGRAEHAHSYGVVGVYGEGWR